MEQQLTEKMDSIMGYLNNLCTQMDRLEKAQTVSNLLALSNNPSVPENLRQSSLARAMNLMGFEMSNTYTNEEKNNNDLSGRVF